MAIKLNMDTIKRALSYIWSEFLFSKEFEFTTTLSPEVAADHIRRLEIAPPETLKNMIYRVKRQTPRANSIPFDVQIRWRSSMFQYTGAHVFGTLVTDAETGLTRVSGEGRFGTIYYFGLLGYSAVIMIIALADTPSNNCFWLWLAMALVIMMMVWRQIFVGRNRLIQVINDAVQPNKYYPVDDEIEEETEIIFYH